MVARALRGRNSDGAQSIIPRVYLSDYGTATNAQDLSRLAATHIVSILEQNVDLPPSIKEGNKLHIKIADTTRANLLQHLDKTTAFIQAALVENETNVVVVHCIMGISRSATVVCAYLIAHKNMKAEEAIAYAQSKRPVVCPNLGFREQLEIYESKLQSNRGQDSLLAKDKEGTELRMT